MSIRFSPMTNQPGLSLAVVLAVALLGLPQVPGMEPTIDAIVAQTKEINCSAEDMRQEIKIHFRGTRCFGKLLAVNGRIKARSAAVNRRYQRDPEYRLLQRDIAKLNELAYELSDVYRDAIAKSEAGKGRPLTGDTRHVVDKLANMIVMTESLNATMLSAMLPVSSSQVPAVEFNYVSEFDPNHDIAPDVSPVVNQPARLQFNHDAVSNLELEPPVPTADSPELKSVLDK